MYRTVLVTSLYILVDYAPIFLISLNNSQAKPTDNNNYNDDHSKSLLIFFKNIR